ncbi:MAG: uroporphyrinogen-III synthase [Bacillota bacterium]|nr:uroporphyrinogen-III synthase [Bacillota bacterium]
MIEFSPLCGKKILVPRGEKEAQSFSQLIEKYRGIPIEIPLIAFRPKRMDAQLEECLNLIQMYDWIIFTSKVTVETLFSFIDMEALFPTTKIAVIGKKTEKVLQEMGLEVAFSPTKYVAETFVEEFLPYVEKGMKVFIPKGNLAREYIGDCLKSGGAEVNEAVVYETYMPEESKTKLANMMAKRELDILMFTSPSTVDHFMSVIKDLGLESSLQSCLISCIGPVTENKIKSYGLTVHAAPLVYTVEEMIKSMSTYLLENAGGN